MRSIARVLIGTTGVMPQLYNAQALKAAAKPAVPARGFTSFRKVIPDDPICALPLAHESIGDGRCGL